MGLMFNANSDLTLVANFFTGLLAWLVVLGLFGYSGKTARGLKGYML
jgi:hypothetical protein